MPVLNIDGRKVKVDDSFLKLSPEEQNRTVEEIASSLGVSRETAAAPAEAEKPAAIGPEAFDKNDPRFSGAGAVGGKFVEGALGLGAFKDKAGAAISAAAQPLTGVGAKGEAFADRYARNLVAEKAASEAFEAENPGTSTTAKIAGGVASVIPLVAAAPRLMGAAGTLPQMIKYGAGSGAALGAGDAALRGEDVPIAAGVGGLFGAGAPLVGRGIGKVVEAVRGRGSAPAPLVQDPAQAVTVGGVTIPLKQSQVTGDAAQSAEEQILGKGGRGDRAQGIAQEFEAEQAAKVAEAQAAIAAGLDPSGASAGTTPAAAGQRVLDELTEADATRLATEQARRARVDAEAERLRRDVGLPGTAAVDSPYAAAEAVGAGVTRARDDRVAQTRGLYGQVRDEAGAFDPAVPRGISEDIRARINTGDEPLWVDPNTSSVANTALRVLDQTLGADSGLFRNAAAARPAGPVGPVAEAAAPPRAQTEAETALNQLLSQGINPARARAAVADLPGGASLRPGVLEPHDVATADGKSVRVAPKVVEASDLRTSADDGYDRTLQPRDRARAASSTQVNDIAKNLNPQRLGVSSEADRGAPIVGADRMVESGNGRVLGIRQAYREGGEAAAKYRAWLSEQGVDVSKYREPVLVRERVTAMSPEERRAFTVSANQSATLSMSAPERALADSRALSPDTLALIRNPADLGAVDNRDFVRQFMQGVPQAERGALMTASGDLSSEGLARVRNAVLAKAYGDTPVLARIAESTKDDIKSISNALTEAAPEWAALKGSIAAGRVPAELDATADLLDAVNRTARIRGQGVGLKSSQAQADAFSQQTPESALFQRMFYDADGAKAAPASQVSSALRNYAQEAGKVDAAPSLGLGLPPVTARDILETTARKVGAPKELAKEVVERAEAAAAPAAVDAAEPAIGLKEMDSARKRLVRMYSDARSEAQRTGNQSDVRAMGKILHAFDDALIDAFEGGKFSGDSVRAQQLLRDARASYAEYRETFTSRGRDPVGLTVEKILGRHGDTAMTPDQIAAASYGPQAHPGGGQAQLVAQRLRSILGETSPEWGAYKQGLVRYLIDPPADGAALAPGKVADRINEFLTGTRGRGFANSILSDAERASLRGYADNLRATVPRELGAVEGKVAQMTGRDGGRAWTPMEVVEYLTGATGRGAKGVHVGVAQQLKRDLTKEGWDAIRATGWQRVISPGEGMIPFEAQALSQRISKFLEGDMVKALYTEAERTHMRQMQKAYQQMIPVKGTTNPSGTAPMLAKIANKSSKSLLALLGAASHGFPGLAAGWAVQKGLDAYAARGAGKEAIRRFYGPQPKAVPRQLNARVPVLLSQGGQASQR